MLKPALYRKNNYTLVIKLFLVQNFIMTTFRRAFYFNLFPMLADTWVRWGGEAAVHAVGPSWPVQACQLCPLGPTSALFLSAATPWRPVRWPMGRSWGASIRKRWGRRRRRGRSRSWSLRTTSPHATRWDQVTLTEKQKKFKKTIVLARTGFGFGIGLQK